jgi:hypothetical protein
LYRAVFEVVIVVASFNNMAMAGETIKQGGGPFWIAKHKLDLYR